MRKDKNNIQMREKKPKIKNKNRYYNMKKDVILPTSLEDVRLEDLIKYLLYIENPDETTEEEKIYKAFEQFVGLNKEEVDLINIKDLKYMYSKMVDMFKEEPEFTNRFILNGLEYGMIPNLDDMSFGEYTDLDTFITPTYQGEIKYIDSFKFMSVLFRPIKNSTGKDGLYSIEDYNFRDKKQRWENMKDCPSSIYLSSIGFFLDLRKELLKSTLSYLENQTSLMKQVKGDENSIKIGDGSDRLITSLTEISQKLIMLQNSILKNVLPSLLSINKIKNSQN